MFKGLILLRETKCKFTVKWLQASEPFNFWRCIQQLQTVQHRKKDTFAVSLKFTIKRRSYETNELRDCVHKIVVSFLPLNLSILDIHRETENFQRI